jgi:hypothetical protein
MFNDISKDPVVSIFTYTFFIIAAVRTSVSIIYGGHVTAMDDVRIWYKIVIKKIFGILYQK